MNRNCDDSMNGLGLGLKLARFGELGILHQTVRGTEDTPLDILFKFGLSVSRYKVGAAIPIPRHYRSVSVPKIEVRLQEAPTPGNRSDHRLNKDTPFFGELK